MFPVDIGNHGNGRGHLEKGAVTFIGLGYDVIPLSEQSVGPDTFQPTPDDHCGIQSSFCKNS